MLENIISVTGQKWGERRHEPRDALTISQQLGLPEIMGRILASRGVKPHEAESFLKPTLREFLPDPFHLKDMRKAAALIAQHIIGGTLPPVSLRETPPAGSSPHFSNDEAPPRTHKTVSGIAEEFYTTTPLEGERSGGDPFLNIWGSPPKKIGIFGDYDVDGATSSALLVRYFRHFGIEPLVHIPDRIKEGYGPNTQALLSLKERGAEIVITVDCGTMSFEPLARAKEAGIEVIVVDHHKSDTKLPEAFAIINPNRFDEESPHKQLAACGVVFLLLVAVNKILKEVAGCKLQVAGNILRGDAEESLTTTPRSEGVSVSEGGGTHPFNKELPDLMNFLDIVALGTICDVVPLTGVNRALVTQGLKILAQRNNAGISAAMDTAKLLEAPTTYHAGYIIGPRINAGGRVGKSDLGIRLLATEDALEAKAIAEELHHFNNERKAIESLVQEEAMQDALALPASDAAIIVAREGWHPGVIGIVSGRLKEHFNKPTAVISLKDGIGKASARSIQGIDLGAAVIAANHSGILLGGGGHAMAAGFTIEEAKIAALREFFNVRLSEKVNEMGREKYLHIDGLVSLKGLNTELVQLINKAGPFGAGNSNVRLMLAKVKVVRADIIGESHVRAILAEGSFGSSGGGFKAMAFRSVGTDMGDALLHANGRLLHIAGQAKINEWQGRESVDFFIDDVAFA